jgi:hypothetical protein
MNEWALAAYLTLFASDAISTHQGLRLPQAHEVFLTQHAPVNDALITGQAIALWWATSKIQRPILRWSVRFGIAGLHGYAAAHNWYAIDRAQRR